MRKKISILIIGILVISGISTIFYNNNTIKASETENIISKSFKFNEPIQNDFNTDYISLQLENTNRYLYSPEKPILPKVVKIYELDFGIKNVQVNVFPTNIKTMELNKKIRPSPYILPLSMNQNMVIEPKEDKTVYEASEAYPNSWYDYKVTCGVNSNNKRVTFVTLDLYPDRYIPNENKLNYAEGFNVIINYDDPDLYLRGTGEYDLVIIAPPKFENDLQRLVNHKNNYGINTLLKTTNDIYNEFSGVDKPEKIKYFIEHAISSWDIDYVLLVGGLDSLIWANPRDHQNYGDKDWLVPIRYNNIYDNPKYPLDSKIQDPGTMSDLYYADVYKEGGIFEDWDPNGDGIIGAWDFPNDNVENDTGIDMTPDVAVGRLACRNTRELKLVIDKIIYYETHDLNEEDWFKKIITVTGDGFLDQTDLDIQWDTSELDDGEYTIYARSNNPEGTFGPIDEIHITLDKTKETAISFNHDDHLKFDTYPYDPIAEITSPSNGDILGNSDFFEIPDEDVAYCNTFLSWADLNYTDEIMHIRGKSYDPKPYGVKTDIHVWIKNSAQEIVFEDWRNDTEMYFEGEWVTGDQSLLGNPGALHYIPNDFTKEILWSSNGKFTGSSDVIKEFNKGAGFIFFSGHGSPQTWGNHKSGVPGNRRNSHLTGLDIIDIKIPFLPMESLKNFYKTPIVLVGGCHNSQFNVSLIPSILNIYPSMWTHGAPAPETWSWWLTRLNKRGSLATIGNTGFGYGIIGKDCTSGGLDGGICIEFFKQYSQGYEYLGDIYRNTQTNYVNNFDVSLQEHAKSLQQWALLGDPSLKIGGYATSPLNNLEISISGEPLPGEDIEFQANIVNGNDPDSLEWNFDLDEDGIYDVTLYGESVQEQWDQPGVFWVNVVATYGTETIIYDTVIEIENEINKPAKPSGPSSIGVGKTAKYSTSAVDPNNDGELWYIFDWGDGTYGYSGPRNSGETGSATHKWTEKGNYEIKVIVFDEYGRISPWSDPLSVSITKSRSRDNQLLIQILNKFFENHPNLLIYIQQILNI